MITMLETLNKTANSYTSDAVILPTVNAAQSVDA